MLRHAFVRRAAPDGQCLVVGPEKAVHQVDRVCVVGHRPGVIEPADHPGPLGIDFVEVVGRDFVAVIVGVQNPRQAQLVQIVEALNALGFGLRFCERRQQQRGQDRDDRDDHQQFDERKATALENSRSSANAASESKRCVEWNGGSAIRSANLDRPYRVNPSTFPDGAHCHYSSVCASQTLSAAS